MNFLRNRLLCITIIVVCIFSVYVLSRTHLLYIGKKTDPICKDCNVILISLDSCGAKHMSAYGYDRDTTPNLTALSKQGILFENNYANATWTFPSHTAMFTGLFPMVSQVNIPNRDVLDNKFPLLPDILQQQGYETLFFAPRSELNIAPNAVFNRGISWWDPMYLGGKWESKDFMKTALTKFEENTKENKKTFMFFHTYMCHGPYTIGDTPRLYQTKVVPSIPTKDEEIFSHEITKEFMDYFIPGIESSMDGGQYIVAPEKIRIFIQQLKNAKSFVEKKNIYLNAKKQDFWGELPIGDWEQYFFTGNRSM